jgi:hypothetical protein
MVGAAFAGQVALLLMVESAPLRQAKLVPVS